MQCGDKFALIVRQRRWHGDPTISQMTHQFQIKRQLCEGEFFKDSQDKFTTIGIDKKITVFDTGGNATNRCYSAERKLFDPRVTAVKTAINTGEKC